MDLGETDMEGDGLEADPVAEEPASPPRGYPEQPLLSAEVMKQLVGLDLSRSRALVRSVLPRGFYVSVDRVNGLRTLHCLTCYRTPVVDFRPWWFAGTGAPGEDMYERACRSCFEEGTVKTRT